MTVLTVRRRILLGVIAVAAVGAAWVGTYLVLGVLEPRASNQQTIENAVQAVKNQSQLPEQVDAITRLDNVTAESSAIHYHYTITGTDPSDLPEQVLRDSIAPDLCSIKATRGLLDQGIYMKYSYDFEGSDVSYQLKFGKADC